MKRVIAWIILLTALLTFSACSEQTQDGKQSGAASSASKNANKDGHTQTDKNSESTSGASNDKNEGEQTKQQNELVGAWYWNSRGRVVVFTDDGIWTSLKIDCSNEGPYLELYGSQEYNITDSNRLIAYSNEYFYEDAEYEFTVDGNTLNLFDADYPDVLSFTKAQRSTQTTDPLIGSWRLLSVGYVDNPAYDYQYSDLTFYADGTYVSKRTNEEKTTNGTYSIIHDGATLEMAGIFYEYWDYEFIGNDVMLLSSENCQLVYYIQ